MDTVIKYPEDLTGSNPSNLVSDEEILLPRVNNRGFAPRNGPFYADSFVLYHKASGKLLIPGVDYQILVMNQHATRMSGQLVCSLIYVNNPQYSEGFRYSYQAIGGLHSINVAAIELMIEALQLDGRSIVWDDILDKPVLFPPAPHLHNVTDWFGMEAVVDSINNLAQIIAVGDVALKDQLLTRLVAIQNALLLNQQATTTNALAISQLADRVTANGG